jgi:iron complex transport system substrate-binding protein
MRIVSLLPSATEMVCALGLADCLVGISHECDFPPEVVADLPRLTRSAIAQDLSAAAIDKAVSEQLQHGDSLYVLDEERLAALQVDLLITQELCDVCAVNSSQVKALAARLPGHPAVLSLTPPNLGGIFEDIQSVAAATGVPERGKRLVRQLRARLEAVEQAVEGQPRPRVFACEWLDPPFAAGHWIPEMVALAGGEEVVGHAGEKSVRVTWDDVVVAAPEVVLLMPCGYSAAAAANEWAALPKPPGWETLPAARTGRVHALDANRYCSRPGPRVAEGVEQIARLLHPAVFP